MVLGFSSRRSAPHRARRSLLRPLIVIAVLGGLVWFAPAIVVNSPLKETILRSATEGLAGRAATGAISAGWLSPLVVYDVVVEDEQGGPILAATSLRSEKTLASLLMDRTQLGVFHVEQPKLNLVLTENSSNLEDALRPWLAKPASSSPAPACAIEVASATVEVTDQVTGHKWSLNELNASASLPGGGERPTTLSLDGSLRQADGRAGKLAGELRWQPPAAAAAAAGGNGEVKLTVQQFPLVVSQSLLRRAAVDVQVAGALSGSVQLAWDPEGQTLNVDDLQLRQFVLAAPAWLGPDQLALEAVDARGEIARRGNAWHLVDAVLASDAVSLRGVGSGTIGAEQAADWSSFVSHAARHGSYQVAGNFDAARLAAMMPHTLRIRESTRLTSGQVSCSIISQPGPQGNQWDVRVRTIDLAGTHNGLPVSLDKPIEITLAARQDGTAMTVDKLSCKSSFLDLTGQGSLLAGSATARGDLTQFVREVSRFVDLGNIRLAGKLRADVDWNHGAGGLVTVEGRAVTEQFELVAGDQPPWREEQLTVTLAATGLVEQGRPQTLQQARLRLESAGDLLDAEIAAPVSPVSWQATWPVRAHVEGQLRTWLPRWQRLLPLDGWSLDGAVTADVQATAAAQGVEIAEADVSLQNLHAVAAGMRIREPTVRLTASGRWDARQQQLFAETMTLASSAVAFRATELSVQMQPGDVQAAGQLGYRADLARLAAWWDDPQQPPPRQFRGEATGRVQLVQQDGVTSAVGSAEVKEFAYATRPAPAGAARPAAASGGWQTVWYEPQLNLSGSGRYAPRADRITLDEIEVAGQAFRVGAQGTVSQPAGRCYVDLSGQLGYDLEQLTEKLRPQLGPQVQLVGRSERPFSFRGPLFAATPAQPAAPAANWVEAVLVEMVAQAGLAWHSANIHGVAIGPGQLESELSDGVLNIRPLELALSEGTLRMTPRVDLRQTPARVQLARGPLVQQLRISPQMCHSWLKYVAPLVAGAAAAEGRFSVDLESATIPLSDPTTSQAAGTLVVHTAQIGPGPLSRELLWIAEQVRAIVERRPLAGNFSASGKWLEMSPQKIELQMADRRVYHRGLQTQVGDVVIRTSGSVGMDQTLSMIAEVPVRDQWVARDRYLAGLKGQVLKIPISGTLTRPRVDGRALESLTRQMVQGAASGLLQQGINRGLEELFGPLQPGARAANPQPTP